MAPKSKQGKKAQPGEGKSQPNRVTVHLPEMLVEALQRVYKTEDVQRAMLQSAENSLPRSRWPWSHRRCSQSIPGNQSMSNWKLVVPNGW